MTDPTPLRASARQAVALLPCPFCGRSAVLREKSDNFTSYIRYECEQGENCDGRDAFYKNENAEAEARDNWNRRALPDSVPAEGAVLPEQRLSSECKDDVAELARLLRVPVEAAAILFSTGFNQCRERVKEAQARAHAGWVSVSERLPDGGSVFVYGPQIGAFRAWFSNYGEQFEASGGTVLSGVTHWQYDSIPAPPAALQSPATKEDEDHG